MTQESEQWTPVVGVHVLSPALTSCAPGRVTNLTVPPLAHQENKNDAHPAGSSGGSDESQQ